jgi:uncharacterized protein (TIGR02284 family)
MAHHSTPDTLDELMQTLQDGADGFAEAAERLDHETRTSMAISFRELGQQRLRFHDQLKTLATDIGHEPTDAGTVAAKIHRSWMGIKDMLADDPDGILGVAEQGEAHAIGVYERAAQLQLPDTLHDAILDQLTYIQAAHEKIKTYRQMV